MAAPRRHTPEPHTQRPGYDRPASAPSARSGRAGAGTRAGARLAERAGAVAFWLVAWQVASAAVNSALILAGPLDALAALVRLVQSPAFWGAAGFSCVRIVGGALVGYLVALGLAAAAHARRIVRVLLAPALTAVKSTPVVCVVVLLLIWLGSANVSFAAVLLMVVPAVYFPALKGLDALDPKLAELFDAHRVRGMRRLLGLVWPGVLPYLAAASEATVGMSWKAGVAAELIGIPSGSVGERIYQAKLLLETGDLFAWTFAVVAASWACEKIVLRALAASGPAALRRAARGQQGRAAREALLARPGTGSAPASEDALCAARDLACGYNGRAVSRPVSFSLMPGERLCVLGPSGAGKTTLLKTVAGLVEPVSGALAVRAASERNRPRAAVVFQDTRLIDQLDAVDNVLLFSAAGTTAAEAHALLAELLPNEALGRPVAQLSGGQRRRVELARALAAPGALVILDEPFGGLDARAHERACAVLSRHLESRALVVATHDEKDATRLHALTLMVGP